MLPVFQTIAFDEQFAGIQRLLPDIGPVEEDCFLPADVDAIGCCCQSGQFHDPGFRFPGGEHRPDGFPPILQFSDPGDGDAQVPVYDADEAGRLAGGKRVQNPEGILHGIPPLPPGSVLQIVSPGPQGGKGVLHVVERQTGFLPVMIFQPGQAGAFLHADQVTSVQHHRLYASLRSRNFCSKASR